ncbi:energy-coupling factor transporter transmembrane protein EcfT [Candidatus Bathyarchaeota archaeon]|nr:energy-coupling factor transporter transmembrane protein EcfT [Candidatus Bathyarchaeota archaeon]
MGILDHPMLEYVHKDTLMHRMNPISKTIFLVSLTLLAQFYFDPRYILPILVFLIILAKPISKIPNSWLLPMYIIGTMSVLERGYNAAFIYAPQYYRIYDPQWMTKTLLYIIKLPVIGEAKITIGGLIWLLAMGMRYFTALFAVSVFLYTTRPSDIIQFLARKKVPKTLLYIVFAGFNFFPILLRYARTIMNAQHLRGIEFSNNPAKLIRTLVRLFHPLIIRLTSLADTLTLSASIRGFGSGEFSYYREIRLSTVDWVLIIGSLVFFGIMFAFLVLFNWGTL